MATIDIKVPDIGDFKDVAVIEVLVKPGDTVKPEQSLITVESDKASMEIPSSAGGVVKELRVKVGDTVNEGSAILVLEGDGAAASAGAATGATAAAAGSGAATAANAGAPAAGYGGTTGAASSGGAAGATAAPAAPGGGSSPAGAAPARSATPPRTSGPADLECDLLVLGAGPGGYSAAFRGADLGLKTVLVERFATLGGVCLNVGCIPSKALLHVAAVMDEVKHFESMGVTFAPPSVDLEKLRAHKSKVVGKLTGGLAAMAKMRKVTVVQGSGEFIDAYRLQVTKADGGTQTIGFKRAIIAAGSEAVKLPFLPKDDPRVVTSTGALELRQNPKRMLVIGGGIIGLEMGTVYSTLGARLDVVEMLDGLMQGADRDLVKVWQKMNAPRFDNILLKTKTVGAEATEGGIKVSFEGEGGVKEQTYDLVLQAVGRVPNGKRIGADKAGVEVGERGFISVDIQMRTSVAHIFAIGDIVGQPMLAHKAVHEAHVAAEVAAGELLGDDHLAKAAFDARVIPSVAYTDPEVAWVGVTEDDAKARGLNVKKSVFPWSASGRAIANGRDEGFTKLLFDADTHQIVGGAIVGTHAGDMIGEVALAIEMGADAVDIGKTIHPHPTLGESLGMAAEAFEGACTDLPPVKR
ncbi:dihydrolipoyl dehydrogenase [Piscinibacter koreensis]|uniref:Dihydrolipoyl dehydrogenase n=1 Tax=Piscinibacter koreensis TaxID=2742824 RepID=A0A7Y6TVH9_9BURK|nr:dihydrolipoyl dehydrogenase [Schlegelella koreensis]NUZ05060.1 dihydrolipoyl dehydrogenase [Schlegelella koreensis]